jgi:hypothetical protein
MSDKGGASFLHIFTLGCKPGAGHRKGITIPLQAVFNSQYLSHRVLQLAEVFLRAILPKKRYATFVQLRDFSL